MKLEGKEDLEGALARLRAYWDRQAIGRPVMWVTAPNGLERRRIPAPPTVRERWTNPDYIFDCVRERMRTTYFAGEALPTHWPNLGPSIVNAWLGAELVFAEDTSWVHPHVPDAEALGALALDRSGWAWQFYMGLVRRSLEEGRGRWVTGYPDLHTGSDAQAAARGPEQFAIDLLESPEAVRRGLARMTAVWKQVVDEVSALVVPAGQGTANWMTGWSDRRFVVIGQNDFTCMVSPEMFREFFLEDNVECCRHVEHTLYHLDGPGALGHLEAILGIEELDGVQWVPGAGGGPMTRWIPLLQRIQAAGKCLHLGVEPAEVPRLLRELSPQGLLLSVGASDRREANDLVRAAGRA